MKNILSTSQLLEQLANNHNREKISLGEIKSALHERGFGILFVVFCLPLLIPLPIPTGLGTVLSLPIMYFALQLTLNADSPWLPKWILNKELNTDTFKKIIYKSLKYLRFIEKFLKERWLFISGNRKAEIFTGLFILLLNIPIFLPFPMSNTLPAVSIIIISFGMIEKDGLMIVIGKIVGIVSWLLCIFIGFAIYYGANKVVNHMPESFKEEVKQLKEYVEPEIKAYKHDIDNDADYYIIPVKPASESK